MKFNRILLFPYGIFHSISLNSDNIVWMDIAKMKPRLV